ncbi:hypothetical protein [Pontibacter liquoris]|uniref:hypothetical protein n=1 Tax=Pontibacter liquoris TaxID=2905677 RepID=UPI001FA763C0|nr:hypothetical protein [Pontibacter liquoris]
MQFDIDKFFDRLQEQGLSKREASQAVFKEIKDAENQKIAFLDQASENPDYYKLISNHIDSYIIYLKVLHNRIAPHEQEMPEVQPYDTSKAVAYHTMNLLMQLEQLERSRFTKVYNASRKNRPGAA